MFRSQVDLIKNAVRFPEIEVDLSNCEDAWDIEGKVHGQMKNRLFPKKIRQEFTKAVQACATWEQVLQVVQEWVTVLKLPESGLD